MKKRILALNLVLVLLLSLVPMTALAVDVEVTDDWTLYTKDEGSSENVVFTYTPPQSGVYRLFFNTPSTTVSGETLVIFNDGESETTVASDNRYYELEAGKKYKFSFPENPSGGYSVDVKYYDPVDSVDINAANFPDEKFREYVSYNFDVDNDGKLDTYEFARNSVLELSYKDFKSIEGVQNFVYTEDIYCSGNLLASLPDLSGMENLELLYCDDNKLTELPALPSSVRYLNCANNEITEIPTLSPDLDTLRISGNPLNELPDFTQYTKLDSLGIRSLELKELPALPQTLTFLDCSDNKLESLPKFPSNNQDTCYIDCSGNQLTSIALNSEADYWYINVGNNKLPNKAAVTGQNIVWDEGRFIFGEQDHAHDTVTTEVCAATCTQEGIIVTKCNNCEYYKEEAVAMLEHQYGADNKCTTCGEYQCAYDGHYFTGEKQACKYCGKYICSVDNSYTEHKFDADGKCTVCGSVIPEPFTCALDGSTWTLTRDNTLTVVGATKTESYAVAAEYFNGFDNSIKRIVFGEGTTTADLDLAFWNYNELSFGKDVKTVWIQNGYLTSVSVDPANPYLCAENNALYNKDKTELIKYCIDADATSFTIPNTVKVIENDAFRRCKFETITIPEGVITIGEHAFLYSENLTTVSLPATVRNIEYAAFSDCYQLSTVNFGGTLEQWTSVAIGEDNEILTAADIICTDTTFDAHEHEFEIEEVIRPTCAHGGYLIFKCTICGYRYTDGYSDPIEHSYNDEVINGKIYEVCEVCDYRNIPDIVTGNCSGENEGDNATYSWDKHNGKLEITGTGATVDWGYCLPPWLHRINSITIGEGITHLGDGTAMGWYIDDSFILLTSVSLPSTLKSIGNSAFAYNVGLESITLPNGLETIGGAAFRNCYSLSSVNIPASVTSIEKAAFSYIKPHDGEDEYKYNFVEYTVDEGNTTYKAADGILYSADGKTLVNYPAGKTAPTFTVSNSVTALSDWAFYGNHHLKTVTIPASVITIGAEAFFECTNLETVYFEGTATQWEDINFEEGYSSRVDEYVNALKDIKDKVIFLGNSITGSTTDNSVTVSVSGSTDDTLDVANTTVTVTEQDVSEIADKLDETSFAIVENSNIVAYDITLIKDNVETQPKDGEKVQVAIDVPAGYTGENCEVYHVKTNPDGTMTFTPMNAKLIGGKLVFETDHFSTYVIAHTHEYTDAVTAPTCNAKGFTTHSCKYCDDVKVDTYVAALGHDYKNGACTRCGATDPNYTKPTEPGHTHSYTTKVVDPTCTEQGYTLHTCSGCGDSYKDTYVAATGHKYLLGECRVCGAPDPNYETIIPSIPSHTHEFKAVVTEPTCTDMGYTTNTCDGCGFSYKSSFKMATGHKIELQNAKAATCTTAGYTGDEYCTVCKQVVEKGTAIKALGHTTELQNVKAATCTAPGYSGDKYCTVCKQTVEKGTEVKALGHNYVGGVCSTCGATNSMRNPFKDVDKTTHADYYDAILWAYYNDITKGTNAAGDMFSPELGCTRAQIVTFLWRQSGAPVAEVANPFVDVDKVKHADYYNAILWGYSTGVIKGVSDTEFAPDKVCTRAEIVTMLYRLDGENAVKTGTQFTDLTQAWYKDAIAWAVAEKITKGTSDTTFTPDAPCTRAQTVTFLYRYFA